MLGSGQNLGLMSRCFGSLDNRDFGKFAFGASEALLEDRLQKLVLVSGLSCGQGNDEVMSYAV